MATAAPIPPTPSAVRHPHAPGDPPPVVFIARGLTHDVCLKVFTREFHLHSVVLRQHSTFFDAFMKPADALEPPFRPFKYDFAARVTDDGDWYPASIREDVSMSVFFH